MHCILTKEQIALILSSNISRWEQESDNKYQYSEVNEIFTQEVDLIKRINQSSKIKQLNKAYFTLADTFHEIINEVKGIKSILNQHKETIVNSIEKVKDFVFID